MENNPNGWEHHKRLVRYRLDGIEKSIEALRYQTQKMEQRQVAHATTMRITAAALGAMAGLIPTLAALFIGGRL